MNNVIRVGKAVVSTDDTSYQMARSRRQKQKDANDRLSRLEEDIRLLKEQMQAIVTLNSRGILI